MSFKYDQCENVFSRKDSLTRHKISVHKNASTNKRKYPDDDAQVSNSPPIKQLLDHVDNLNEQACPSECSLKRRDSTTDTEQSLFNDQPVKSFKFKHPCCMMVSGPSQSGKTTWTVRLLERRNERFQMAVDATLGSNNSISSRHTIIRKAGISTQYNSRFRRFDGRIC